MKLLLLENDYSIFKFDPDFSHYEKILSDEFFSITKTKDELSIAALENSFSDFLSKEDGWKIIKIDEELDFSLTGILSKISAVLAGEDIGIFVLSTYNTDYIMIKKENVNKAVNILINNGYLLNR
ncbi:MAG: ACT domain-containing protein [Treponema sp.]|nr:ACT domain-containing protein [Treponema sp.]